MSKHTEDPRIEIKPKNGDHEEPKEQAKQPQEKKSWWDKLSPEVQVISSIALGITGFIAVCFAGEAIIKTIDSSNARKTMNSAGFKDMLDRGVLDPVPPPKTLEESAARILEHQGRNQFVVIDDGMYLKA